MRRTKDELQNQIIRISDSVGKKVSDTLKSVERNCIDANNLFCESVKERKADFAKTVEAEQKAFFKIKANIFVLIFAGIFASFLGIMGFEFFKIGNGYYKELVEKGKLESIQKQAVSEYKKDLINGDSEELNNLVKAWYKKHGYEDKK